MMELSEFVIGHSFWVDTTEWRCTDIGSRVVAAIQVDADPQNMNGPPYSIVEHVFDEYDQEACSLVLETEL